MYELKPIAHIETDFPTKFGIPRQSGLVSGLRGRIVFEPEYRDPEALRGLENFSHVWLLWDFSEARREGEKWQPTVRPPRLGGNRRMGVFATRSPFRPNNIGLSSVRILSIDLHTPVGPVIEVEGADLMSGTPIFDIKPYLAFTDSHPDATGSLLEGRWKREDGRGMREDGRCGTEEGRAESVSADSAIVNLHPSIIEAYDAEHVEALREILLSDPRPHYHDDPDRVYAFLFAGREVKFRFAPGRIEAWTE
ncbi:MAG: tRNA (N6-threonylcarbamoyladenosine(37)-N6)-methyltransferase TrmO [Bacteroidaceae bacterium]|nr:tRNA (N6-threonylcarbamoyladenosine(37)-N6)-methyltransferase TrmO [Bacteroidaceae bacterium]